MNAVTISGQKALRVSIHTKTSLVFMPECLEKIQTVRLAF